MRIFSKSYGPVSTMNNHNIWYTYKKNYSNQIQKQTIDMIDVNKILLKKAIPKQHEKKNGRCESNRGYCHKGVSVFMLSVIDQMGSPLLAYSFSELIF